MHRGLKRWVESRTQPSVSRQTFHQPLGEEAALGTTVRMCPRPLLRLGTREPEEAASEGLRSQVEERVWEEGS